MRLAVSALLLAVASLAGAQDNLENLVRWREGLASSAQPKAEWLKRAKEQRYDLVVNLAPPQSHGSIDNEGGLVGRAGAAYLNIPVDFKAPKAGEFQFFSDVLKAAGPRNVLVHCQVNLRGTSFVFLYRVIHEGADPTEAWAKLTGIWQPDPVWKKFITDTLQAHGKKADLL